MVTFFISYSNAFLPGVVDCVLVEVSEGADVVVVVPIRQQNYNKFLSLRITRKT